MRARRKIVTQKKVPQQGQKKREPQPASETKVVVEYNVHEPLHIHYYPTAAAPKSATSTWIKLQLAASSSREVTLKEDEQGNSARPPDAWRTSILLAKNPQESLAYEYRIAYCEAASPERDAGKRYLTGRLVPKRGPIVIEAAISHTELWRATGYKVCYANTAAHWLPEVAHTIASLAVQCQRKDWQRQWRQMTGITAINVKATSEMPSRKANIEELAALTLAGKFEDIE